jgi:NAD(P)-dependent dehydrogenase (short-subunit alcohol dehydrogenase family)
MNKKVWLVTGCSTGFGKEFIKQIAEIGDYAIGTVRKESQIKELERVNPALITGVLLDVQDQKSIDAALQLIVEKYGRLDVLINNAGYGSMGAVEEVPEQEILRQFDVNVFGAIRMIKLALPFMRKQRSGNILNITSIAGLNGFPGVGIYNGSKFALEGIGEALAAEVRHLGIKVTNVEPGPFKTEWAGPSATFGTQTIDDYRDTAYKNMEDISKRHGEQPGDPVKAVKAMIELTKLEHPPVHLPLGGVAYKRAHIKLDEFKSELNAFEYLGKPTDFDR